MRRGTAGGRERVTTDEERYGWWARKSDNRRGEVRVVGEKE